MTSSKTKRKDLDEVYGEFSDFSLNSPARKIRRLDAELPPIVEEKDTAVPLSFEQQMPEGLVTVDAEVSLPLNEERALVLYKPVDNPLALLPGSSNAAFAVSSDLVTGLKSGRREDDWTCPSCGNVNFSFRTTCNMHNCSQSRPADHNAVDTMDIGRRNNHVLYDDALAQALMDPNYPTESLPNYDEWTLDLRKLNMGMAFAQGAFGKLYRGTYNGEDVAIKLLEKPENDPERAQLMEKQFVQEVMMLANLRHPNVVRFVGACRKPMVGCIVTEYAEGGSVRRFLTSRQNRVVPLTVAVKQALDVARGMAYVHGLGFIHRDLKSDNLLIFGDKSIKIADFGVGRIEVKTAGMTPETGTLRWMAPEMILHRPYNQKVDVYSFGIVLWELITGMLPYQNMTAIQAAFAVVSKGARPIIPTDCLPVLREIMTRCWDANPDVHTNYEI